MPRRRAKRPEGEVLTSREREIAAFKKHKYWTVSATLWPHGHHDALHTFDADLISVAGRKSNLPPEVAAAVGNKSTYLTTLEDATALAERLGRAPFSITAIKRSERRDNPRSPFTTSTLQQEASRRLKMRVRKTMQMAQSLYEGVDTGEGTVGLITYMRTDSTRLSEAAQVMARDYIVGRFGEDYHAGRQFKVSETAQDAHEAIRPTDVSRTPAPRFDLLRIDRYDSLSVQFSRGCPFNCEFCDIIEIFGRVPRTKSPEPLVAELDLPIPDE